MNFFKVKRIAVKMNGLIMAICDGGHEIVKTPDAGWRNDYYEQMTPLFDVNTGDLVGFFNPKEITVEFEEE